MNPIHSKICLVLVFASALAGLTTSANAQMEKRTAEHYLTAEFLGAAPAVGSKLSEMTFQTLEGKEVKLSSYLGKKTLVLIKAGYT